MDSFTPISSLIGGALIGLSAVMLMAFYGRVAGISGILGGSLFSGKGGRAWRLVFLLGLIGGPLAYTYATGLPIMANVTAPLPIVLIGGALVGFGTRMGSGCTSGHGVCGMSSFSMRSLIATLTFMSTGIVTVYLVKSILGS